MLKAVASPKKRSFWSLAARLLPLNFLLLEHCTEAEWCLASKEISGKSRDSVRCGYRGGLVSEAHRLFYHSAFKDLLGSVMRVKKKKSRAGPQAGWECVHRPEGAPPPASAPHLVLWEGENMLLNLMVKP